MKVRFGRYRNWFHVTKKFLIVHFHLAFSRFSLICHSLYPSMVFFFLFFLSLLSLLLGLGRDRDLELGGWASSLPSTFCYTFFFFFFRTFSQTFAWCFFFLWFKKCSIPLTQFNVFSLYFWLTYPLCSLGFFLGWFFSYIYALKLCWSGWVGERNRVYVAWERNMSMCSQEI